MLIASNSKFDPAMLGFDLSIPAGGGSEFETNSNDKNSKLVPAEAGIQNVSVIGTFEFRYCLGFRISCL